MSKITLLCGQEKPPSRTDEAILRRKSSSLIGEKPPGVGLEDRGVFLLSGFDLYLCIIKNYASLYSVSI
jgi:hypothetical protein